MREVANSLSFISSVIADTAIIGSTCSGSVNYSASNLVLWGVNNVETICRFYNDRVKVY